MAAARAQARGLGPDEVEKIRESLAAGRRPKVVFTSSAGQIAGQIGQVVQLTDPAVSDEFVVVRFGRDELPFSPGDVEMARRGAGSRKAAPAAGAAPVRREPEFVLGEPARTTARRARSSVNGGAPAALPGGSSGSPAPSARAKSGATAPPARTATGEADGPASSARKTAGRAQTPAPSPREAPAAPASPPRKAAGEAGTPAPTPRKAAGEAGTPAPTRRSPSRGGRGKGPAGLTVTLAYADGEWSVAVAQGAKTLAKPCPVKPSEALRMVSLVDVPGVQEAVEQIVAAERAAAQQQAERLRAELAEIEARLAELDDAG